MCYACRLRGGFAAANPDRCLVSAAPWSAPYPHRRIAMSRRCPVAAPSQSFVSTRPYPSALAHHEALGTAEIQQRHHAYADMTTLRYT